MALPIEKIREQIGELYIRHAPPLRERFGRRGRWHDVGDLVNEAFIRLQKYYLKGKDVEEPEAFLCSTIVRLSVDRYRRERPNLRAEQTPDELELLSNDPTPEEDWAAYRRYIGIRDTLDDTVGRETREVFFMKRIEGYTHAEIAAIRGISVRSVETHIGKAVAALWFVREAG